MSEIADIMRRDRCSWSEAKARASAALPPVRSEPLLDVFEALKDTHRHIEALYELKQYGSTGLDQAYARAAALVNTLCAEANAGAHASATKEPIA
jgi:hypothetical protein